MVSKAIDLIVCTELDPVTHLRHIIRDLQGETLPHACLFPPHHPLEDPLVFEEDVKRVVDLSNIHQHTKTCTKGKAGISGCRLGRPMTLQNKTEPRQIKPIKKLKKSEVVDEKTDTQNTNSCKRKKKNPLKSESVLNPTKKAKKKESLSNIQNEKLKNKSLPSKKKGEN